eukprot:TRINITY_DN1622_c0_g1_i1.p5 TRINITY_DN1622_c0_g1~~TRINITY_DN1622_c0_g1_i1.p5  ORF type:complete len:113 (-),score=6.84 TRINITY_DN1622_c0_g1_i1:1445-1783(-)
MNLIKLLISLALLGLIHTKISEGDQYVQDQEILQLQIEDTIEDSIEDNIVQPFAMILTSFLPSCNESGSGCDNNKRQRRFIYNFESIKCEMKHVCPGEGFAKIKECVLFCPE